jgi:hypothetical protein
MREKGNTKRLLFIQCANIARVSHKRWWNALRVRRETGKE